jgi:prepilin-type N-terminal cleavage/methylation domain-containing protein
MVANGRLKAGFTLIELLIAMSIMLGVLMLTATAYQLYTDSWKRDLSRVEQRYQSFRTTELLLDAMQAILPLTVTNDGLRAYYFLGREEGFTAVTYAPIFNVGHPAVMRVFRELNDNGQYRLVYEEASLQNTVLKQANQVLPFNYRVIIADGLPAVSFAYFGWASISSQMSAAGDVDIAIKSAPRWFNEFDGLTRQLHPEKVQIQLGEFSLLFTVPNRNRVNALADYEDPV